MRERRALSPMLSCMVVRYILPRALPTAHRVYRPVISLDDPAPFFRGVSRCLFLDRLPRMNCMHKCDPSFTLVHCRWNLKKGYQCCPSDCLRVFVFFANRMLMPSPFRFVLHDCGKRKKGARDRGIWAYFLPNHLFL